VAEANTTMHQAALLREGHITRALAMLTDGDQTPTYCPTPKGVMSRLLGVGE